MEEEAARIAKQTEELQNANKPTSSSVTKSNTGGSESTISSGTGSSGATAEKREK